MLYADGHSHCNGVQFRDHGFTLGGCGMDGCGQFGFIVLESDPMAASGPDARVDYFDIAHSAGSAIVDNYEGLRHCLAINGYTGCRAAHGQAWRGVPEEVRQSLYG